MTRCSAITKAGKQCSVTSNSNWIDSDGRVVAEPLRRGGKFCALHARPFCTKPTQMDDYKRLVIFILDLETTGTDISQDRIVEIAAARCHDDIRMCGEAFSTTVRVDPDILMTRGLEAFQVHGITSEEIKQGPSFEQAWMRFLTWIEDVTNIATNYESESDDDKGSPTLLENPVVVLAGHNSIRFDFPLLLCELLRHNLSTTMFEQWYFVDTLDVFKDLNKHGCVKLQCLVRETMTDPGHAHRALDDCIALREVTNIFAHRIGTSTRHLLSLYLVELNLASSIAQLTVLM